MTAPLEIVEIPSKYYFHIIRETIMGTFRRCKVKGLPLNETLAMRSFKQRSVDENFDDFTDGSTSWYLSVLDSQVLNDNFISINTPKVLDIGCGRGALLSWLLLKYGRENFSYFGIDQDPVILQKCQKIYSDHQFFNLDIRKSLQALELVPDVIFIINVLPYLLSPTDIFRECSRIIGNDGILIIIDPVPSLYWDKEFENFGICLREPNVMKKYLSHSGWKLVEEIQLTMKKIKSYSLIPITRAYICKKIYC